MATLHQCVVDPEREGVDPGCGWCRWWQPSGDDPDRGDCGHPLDPQEQPTMYFNGCDHWVPDGRTIPSLSVSAFVASGPSRTWTSARGQVRAF